jgi:DNA ligase 1
VLLADLVTTSAAVAATRSRLAKVAALADCLRRAAPGEIAIVTSYLSGELRQRRTGAGGASRRDARRRSPRRGRGRADGG